MASIDRLVRRHVDDLTLGGQLEPGDQLPTERQMAETLCVSRGAIRRALDGLAAEGRIFRTVGRGTFLAEPADRLGVQPTNTSPAEIMQARVALEPAIAGIAAVSARQVDLDRLRVHLSEEGQTNSFENTESADAQIHHTIAGSSHNDLLVAMYEIMHAARDYPVWGSLKRRTSTPAGRAHYHRQHIVIASAITDRDKSAAEATMGEHLETLREDLLG